MSYNNGSKLLVFGLSFAQQDSRKMQQVLGHYRKLPDTTNRAVLFAELNALAKALMRDETNQHVIQAITDWMQHGGPFPGSTAATEPPTQPSMASPPRPASSAHPIPRRRANNYQHRYGQGRTLDSQAEDVPAEEHVHNDQEHDDSDEEMEDDEYNEHDGMDALPQWQNAATGHRLHGPGRTLQDPDEVAPEDLETIQFAGRGNVDADDNAEPSNSNQETSMTDVPNQLTDNIAGAGPDSDSIVQAPPEVEHRDALGTETPGANDKDQIVECPICVEDYPASKFPRNTTITEGCTHPDKACLDCLEASIAAVIERGALHLLACPICPAKLTSRNIEEYASSQVNERYKYLKQQSEIPGHYISCMNPKCGGSQPQEGGDPKMICKFCEFATCAHHRRPWHEGQTCSEFDLDDAQLERLEEEEATAKLLSKEDTSICPKCGQGVTKTEGCDHMSCNCGEEWCYICSCSYENVIRHGAIAHATFCIYHPNKVNLTKTQKEAARNKIMGLVHGGEVSAELSKARDELRERRRAEIRPKVAEAAEARRKLALQQQQEESGSGASTRVSRKKRVKLVAPWEEGGRKKKAL